MKRLILLILILIPSVVWAQENQSYLQHAKIKHGSILVGGNLQGSFYKVSDNLNFNNRREGYQIQGFLRSKNGYFVLHDFAVGLDVSLNHENSMLNDETVDTGRRRSQRETYLVAGPFVRYYFHKGFFADFTVGTGLHNFSSGQKNNIISSTLGIGYSHFINEKIALEPIINFRYFREADGESVHTSFGPMLGFGVQAYLLRRKAHVIKIAL